MRDSVRGVACSASAWTGYYIRVAPPEVPRNSLNIKNRDLNTGVPADEEISIDFLQLYASDRAARTMREFKTASR
jgi:hypothetical protein